jgi:YHS domain-containing protein
MSAITIRTIAVLLSLIAAGSAWARKAEVYTGTFSSLAVGGYDPVAYFTDGKPVEGASAFEHSYKGATWRFVSADSKAKFVANPTAYAPQYGGYCAWAMANNYLAQGSPQYWKIVNGKLYLNAAKSVQVDWEKDIPGFITKADKNWPGILDR